MTDAPSAPGPTDEPGLPLPALDLGVPAPAAQATPYRVLARKYRPSTFAELIGQEPMVRTLSNAIAAGRLAQGFMLTGVRGVGKTTTARIIARGLNCIGPDGTGGPTVEPCGVCVHCVAIAESRHVDVLEQDAASHTGVGDMRELIDGVRYAPNSARFKVHIIDEVHMLSTAAFNALLKTLEEPPPHVKFIMATTEIRKVPVTVLSRCQRFDLRRIETGRLMQHLGRICAAEGVQATSGALALIARAAEGSVRDSLSLLDQAIAHAGGTVAEEPVREMLGLADRDRIFDLFQHVMAGRMAEALAELRSQYDAGAEPLVVLEDLLETTHWLSRLKAVPDAGEDATTTELERSRGEALAAQLDLATLSRVWQMLLKGLNEARNAPSALSAAEMVLIRLCHAADLPNPADLIRELTGGPGGAPYRPPPAGGGGGSGGGARASNVVALRPRDVVAEPQALPDPEDFAAVVRLVGDRKEAVLFSHLTSKVRPLAFAPGRLELNLGTAPQNLTRDLAAKLKEWTGKPWTVIAGDGQGGATLSEQQRAADAALRLRTQEDPLVRAVLSAFPGAQLGPIRDRLVSESVVVPEESIASERPMADDDLVFPDFLDPDSLEGED
ncbi:DNA polymerase III subunit gamma/tau [Zavarzinia sp. CC-PAN008]|uniref:DNA polymerase III subunit gamma/tau n=1 Tax=Zavarzinia sp. CC-PAN008 TaxID=3243332 RepID=UPI003F74835B